MLDSATLINCCCDCKCSERSSYVAKTTQQLKYALEVMDAEGVELRAAELVRPGASGTSDFNAEVDRVRREVSIYR